MLRYILLLCAAASWTLAKDLDTYRWSPLTERHERVFSFSNQEYERLVSEDPRHHRTYLQIKNVATAPKKSHVKVVERKHTYPILASIISIVILFTTIFLIIQYTT